jgi:Tol biopolymer transport system component
MALSAGDRLGPYEIAEPLGAGGMGEVWRARDTRLGRDVALKVLPASFEHDRERLGRLQREARLLASVSHPHIATLYGVEESEGAPVLVMELVEGETLSERLRRGRVRVAEAVALAKQIAEALEAAHEKGILHRDLKPANVQVTARGQVKLLDFGLAKALDPVPAASEGGSSGLPTWSEPRSRDGAIVGTTSYMSPEQARGEALDKRTDVWAFGCLLFEMLTGRVAFAGSGHAERTAAVLGEDPPWTELPRETPPALVRTLERCLRKSKEARLRDVGDALLELEETELSPRGDASARPRRRWAVPGLAVLALLLGGVMAWLAVSDAGRPAPAITRFTITLPRDSVGRLHLPDWTVPLAISSDGRRLVFSAADERGDTRLFLRELDSFESRPLHGTEGVVLPFFSPDGRWIGFQTADGGLHKVSVSGGPAIDIGRAPAVAAALWRADDMIVLSAGIPSSLWRIPAGGGEARPLTVQGEDSLLAAQQLLSGGREVLASSWTRDGDFLERISLETGKRERLWRASVGVPGVRVLPSGHLVYAEKGALLAARFDSDRRELRGAPVPVLDGLHMPHGWYPFFALSDNGTLVYAAAKEAPRARLVWVNHAGAATPVPGAQAAFWGPPRLSPDGRHAAVTLADGRNRHIWIFDLDRGTRRKLTSEGENRSPVWTPDGLTVAFQSNQAGLDGIFSRPADGSAEPKLLLRRRSRVFPSAFTPDGKGLVFEDDSARPTGSLWIHTEGGEDSPLFSSSGHSAWPSFSPDGRWVAFEANDSGRTEVYVQPYPGPGGARAVSSAGGGSPEWAPDGTVLYYQSNRKMMAVSVQAAPDLRLGEPRVLFEGSYGRGFAVSKDGKRFLMLEDAEPAGPDELRVVVNWSEELKRLVP